MIRQQMIHQFYKSDHIRLRISKRVNGTKQNVQKLSHSMHPKRGLYVLKSGASRTAHRTLRPTMLFGQVPAAFTGRSKSSGLTRTLGLIYTVMYGTV